MKNNLCTSLCTLLLFIIQGCALDQAAFDCDLNGTIYNSNRLPLEGVKIELIMAESSIETYSDNKGRYSIKDLTPGMGILTFNKEEYLEQSLNLDLHGKQKLSNDIILLSIAEKSYLTLIEQSRIVESEYAVLRFSVSSNVSYTLSCEANWITIPSTSYFGTRDVTVLIQKNETNEQRSAEIKIEGEYRLTQLFKIIQKAGSAL